MFGVGLGTSQSNGSLREIFYKEEVFLGKNRALDIHF